MDYVLLCCVAFLASGLTLFSGFGLGTLLMPVFALFFPLEIAIALTAIVHLLNNLFKLFLLGKYADGRIVFKFGLPAILAAFFGAWLLMRLSGTEAIFSYFLFSHEFQVSAIKLVIGIMIIIFSLLELVPGNKKVSLDQKYLPVGGLLSGFFGGLSGHQGALRSGFLIRAGLTKEAFIATGVVISCLVDVSRLFIYRSQFFVVNFENSGLMLLAAVAFAFLGAFLGKKYLKKVTIKSIRVFVSILLFIIAICLIMGII